MPEIMITVDDEMLERLEAYRTKRFAPTLEEALRRLMLHHLPGAPEWSDKRHIVVMERLELSQRRARQAIVNRAKCEGAW